MGYGGGYGGGGGAGGIMGLIMKILGRYGQGGGGEGMMGGFGGGGMREGGVVERKTRPPLDPDAPRGFKTGGPVPGKGHQDTVPAMLTPGEFVVKKSVAQKNLGRLKAMNDPTEPDADDTPAGRKKRTAAFEAKHDGQAF